MLEVFSIFVNVFSQYFWCIFWLFCLFLDIFCNFWDVFEIFLGNFSGIVSVFYIFWCIFE